MTRWIPLPNPRGVQVIRYSMADVRPLSPDPPVIRYRRDPDLEKRKIFTEAGVRLVESRPATAPPKPKPAPAPIDTAQASAACVRECVRTGKSWDQLCGKYGLAPAIRATDPQAAAAEKVQQYARAHRCDWSTACEATGLFQR